MSTDPREKFPTKPGASEQPQSYPGSESAMVTKPDFGEASYKGSGRLAGKIALVTGGDSGIGRAVAYAFAKEGATVAITYLEAEEADAAATEEAITAAGGKAYMFGCDLRTQADGLIDRVVETCGGIDILVNNAAIQRYFEDIATIKESDFAEIYQVNVIAPFTLIQQSLEHMKLGSSIINTVSIQAYDPSALLLPYAASKGALVALTKALGRELMKQGIRVNAVAPGPIWSPLNTHGSPPEKLKHFGEKSILGRPGQPIEVAPIYVLLASDEASYITGEIYGVTGEGGIA